MKNTALARLIAEFLEAQQDRHRATWRMADITVTIHDRDGVKGIRALAVASQFTEAYLGMLIRTAKAFPAGTRRPGLSFSLHTEAMHALRRFPEGTPEHLPDFWVNQATVHHLNSRTLHEAMMNHNPADSTLAARTSVVTRKVVVAERHLAALQTDVDAFNRDDAPYWGSRIVLVEQPILSPAS